MAVALRPRTCSGYLVAGHRSTRARGDGGLAYLGPEPSLDLDLRLGEGTGACLALPIVQAAAKILRRDGDVRVGRASPRTTANGGSEER